MSAAGMQHCAHCADWNFKPHRYLLVAATAWRRSAPQRRRLRQRKAPVALSTMPSAVAIHVTIRRLRRRRRPLLHHLLGKPLPPLFRELLPHSLRLRWCAHLTTPSNQQNGIREEPIVAGVVNRHCVVSLGFRPSLSSAPFGLFATTWERISAAIWRMTLEARACTSRPLLPLPDVSSAARDFARAFDARSRLAEWRRLKRTRHRAVTAADLSRNFCIGCSSSRISCAR